MVNITSYGAVMDGVTDCYSAFVAAFASGAPVVTVPNGGAFISQPVTVPSGLSLIGEATNHYGTTGFSSYIIGANGLNECVIIDGGPGNVPVTVKGLGITRAGAGIPAGSKGLVVRRGDHVLVEDVQSHHHAIAVQVEGQLRHTFSRLNTFDVSNTHINIVGGIETIFDNCRFGRNGFAGACPTNYFRISGGGDTLIVRGSVFADNAWNVPHTFLFDGYSSPNGIVLLSNNHIEQAVNLFVTNNTALAQRVLMSGCSVNIFGNLLASTDDLNGDFKELVWTGNNFGGTAPAYFLGATGCVVGNNFNGDVTVNGGDLVLSPDNNRIQGVFLRLP